MKKFLKVLCVIALSLVLCGVVSLAVCYIAIPERTKCAIDIVIGYLNTPLGIAGGTTITLGLVVGIIIKYVIKVGKDNIKEDLEKVKGFNAETVVNAKKYYTQIKQKEEEIKQLILGYQGEIDELTQFALEICKTSPNAKIKALGLEFENKANELKDNIKNEINDIGLDYNKYIENKDKVEKLQDQIKELTEKFERLVENNGEQERVND